jgi:hypothetical protein
MPDVVDLVRQQENSSMTTTENWKREMTTILRQSW